MQPAACLHTAFLDLTFSPLLLLQHLTNKACKPGSPWFCFVLCRVHDSHPSCLASSLAVSSHRSFVVRSVPAETSCSDV